MILGPQSGCSTMVVSSFVNLTSLGLTAPVDIYQFTPLVSGREPMTLQPFDPGTNKPMPCQMFQRVLLLKYYNRIPFIPWIFKQLALTD